MTVTAAPLTITPNNLSKAYGAALPTQPSRIEARIVSCPLPTATGPATLASMTKPLPIDRC